MSQYIVSARKYRPSTFDSVVGQQALTSTLKNAISTDRLAHAYLFCGSRGVGKTSCARIFAKTINCEHRTPQGEACNECESCRAFNEGNSFNIVEMDAASNNGVDDMRALTDQVQMPPTRGRYRVFIIDEVHMLSSAAFNAFLKTLEEPPSFVIFILATTEKHKIIPTILSRCQIFDFNRITIPDMVVHLGKVAASEGISAEPAALNVIARQADGAMRDALSIFDQVAASSRGDITYQSTIDNLNVLDPAYYGKLVEAFKKSDVATALLIFHEIRRKGFDPQFFLSGLGQYMRDLTLASNSATAGLLDAPDDERQAMAQTAAGLKPEFLYAAMGLCNDADLNYRISGNKQLLVELTLIRIAQLLSPSPVKRGQGEGPLRPIAKVEGGQATAASSAPKATQAKPGATTGQAAPTVQPAHASQAASAANPARSTAPAGGSPAATAGRPSHPTVMVTARVASGTPIRIGRPAMQSANTSPAQGHERAESYTPAAVTSAWLAFAEQHNKEAALTAAMRKFVPRPDVSSWIIEADSIVTARLLETNLDTILPYMRNSLRNDSFVLEFRVDDSAITPAYWSDTQVLNHLMENPDFKEFYNALKLTMR